MKLRRRRKHNALKKKAAKEEEEAKEKAEGVSAPGDVVSAPGDGTPATATAMGVPGSIDIEQRVTCPGKKKQSRLAAVVKENHLSKHCWVEIGAGQGKESGTRKKVLKADLKVLPPATKATGDEVSKEDVKDKDDTAAEADAWQEAADVFGD